MDKRIDYISELPEHILHRIMSFLPTKQITRNSVLSKTWLKAWKTSPILEFDFYAIFSGNRYGFPDFETREKNKQELYNFVEQILLSRRKQMISLTKFTLIVPFIYRKPEMVSTMDRWIGYALETNVKHLKIKVGPTNDDEDYKYFEPQAVLNAVSIQILDLSHCKLHMPSMGSLSLPFLRKLSLSSVFADDNIINKLIAESPRIEDMSFINCYGIKSLQIFDLDNLIRFYAERIVHIELLTLEAQNLHSFTLRGSFWPSTLKSYVVPSDLRQLLPSPLHNMKELKLSISCFRHSTVAQLVDAMLCICPHIETLHIDSIIKSYFKFSYQKPTCKTEKDCKSCPVFCWNHCIKEIKVKQISPASTMCWHFDAEDIKVKQVRNHEERNYTFNQDIWENIKSGILDWKI
ncbi:putative F-box/LRR-repeat protein At3g28410 isoform X2 [Manihot esculenta]|uniref:putative F-box/LRR-repeat protein At3g28410 isoform X2 n=1 Tax=Manihot esculenta TaxID=3983 RepID=UPI000B5D0FD8|nr:putative F-box/LRR-repeat protein At3g28410 isoform X2 [Manihot esculenta]